MVQLPLRTSAKSPAPAPARAGRLAQRLGRRAGVLGQRVLPVRFPYLNRQVSYVAHLKARRDEPGGQAS
jgi:hypothetical protein